MSALLLRFSFLFVVSLQVASGNEPKPLAQKWLNRYRDPAGLDTVPTAVAADADGNVYVADLVSIDYYRLHGVVSKLSGTTGATLWRWQSNFDVASGYTKPATMAARLAVGPDGHPIVSFPGAVLKLAKTDGNPLWTLLGNVENLFGSYQMTLDPSGDVVLAGNGMITKVDRDTGLLLWSKTWKDVLVLRTVKAHADGSIYAGGEMSASPYKSFLAKLSPAGVVLWSRIEPGVSSNRPRLLELDPAGNLVVATYDTKLIKYSGADGSQLWSVAGRSNPTVLVLDGGNDIYLAGGGESYPAMWNSVLAKYSGNSGSQIWQMNGEADSNYKVGLLLRGSEFVTYASSSSNLILSGVEAGTGTVKWFQRNHTLPYGPAVATTSNRAVTMMAPLPDGGVVVAGALQQRPNGNFESIVLKFGNGPTVKHTFHDWVLPTRVRLRATAMGNGAPAEIYWEYGLTTEYGNSTPRQSIVEGWSPTPPAYLATIEGLAENTLYHARAVTVSASDTTVTEDFTFTTGWDFNQNKLPDEWELAKWGNTRNHYPTEDEDRDGSINLLEYALDRDPRKSDAANTPAVTIDQDGHLSMTVTKRPHVMPKVEASTDLVSWIPAIVIAETDSTVTAREEFPASTPGGRFLRVRVTSE